MSERFKPHTLEGDERPERTEVLGIGINEGGRTEDTPEQKTIREHIDAIDEKVLQEIFEEEMQRCGIDVSETNFIPLSEIVIANGQEFEEKLGGLHRTSILDNSHDIYVSPEKNSFKSFPQILWAIIHEQLHAVTERIIVTNDSPFEDKIVSVTGVKKSTYTQSVLSDEVTTRGSHFNILNEGITELITERIFRRYAQSTGIGEQREVINEHYGKDITYAAAWQKIQIYVAFITSLSESEFETTEDAVLRAYFRNGSLIPQELIELLEERSPGSSQEISKILNEEFSELGTLNFFLKLPKNSVLTQEERDKFLRQWDKISERIIESRDHYKKMVKKALET